jgi:hypothetical protein
VLEVGGGPPGILVIGDVILGPHVNLERSAVVDESDAVFAFDQDNAGIIYPRAVNLLHGARGVRFHALQRAGTRVQEQPIDERRVVESNEHALRPVLEKPAALIVMLVIAADEVGNDCVGYPPALDEPMTAAVEGKPSIDRRHIRPFGHSLLNNIIHV